MFEKVYSLRESLCYKFVKYRKYFIIITYSHKGKEKGKEREWMDRQIDDGWIDCYFFSQFDINPPSLVEFCNYLYQ